MSLCAARGDLPDDKECVMPVWLCEDCEHTKLCSDMSEFGEWLEELLLERMADSLGATHVPRSMAN